MKILTMILAGGTGKELSVLTRHRAKTALPFGGRYRIIDFCLSNCVNSGLNEIYILAQYNPKSLIEHIRMGKPWDLDRKSGGVFILQPRYRDEAARWYLGTADALYQNIDVMRLSKADYVLVLSGDQVYLADYGELAAFHASHGGPVTIACKSVRPSQRSRFGMVRCDRDGVVREFREKPRLSRGFDSASLGIYLFDRRYLVQRLDARGHDIVFDILMPEIARGGVYAYRFEGYWEDIGSVESYYLSSMRLLRHRSLITSREQPVFTRGANLPPSKFFDGSAVGRSIIADGCTVRGAVRGSILFPGVTVERGAVVEDSIVFSFSRIGADARVARTIIDKDVSIGAGAIIGAAATVAGDARRIAGASPGTGTGGITVLGKGIRVARGATVPAGTALEPAAVLK
ncbi:MAG: glucose-1-phosphate adenylyltransferase subunit GlgD [Candidatus Krumholzibacteria bacterium]|nr:glucose-1-phosphate adenylyltransferase subunit GlgD [Candidatus Krumholzibacteria bacterium]